MWPPAPPSAPIATWEATEPSHSAACLNFTLISIDVYPLPAGSVLCSASPATESSSVHTRPPCTPPLGLYTDPSGWQVNTTLPGSASNQIELHEHGDRGWRKLAGDHRLEIVDPGHGQAARDAGARVVPYDGP